MGGEGADGVITVGSLAGHAQGRGGGGWGSERTLPEQRKPLERVGLRAHVARAAHATRKGGAECTMGALQECTMLGSGCKPLERCCCVLPGCLV